MLKRPFASSFTAGAATQYSTFLGRATIAPASAAATTTNTWQTTPTLVTAKQQKFTNWAEAKTKAKYLPWDSYACLDFETTGGNPRKGVGITEVGLVVVAKREVRQRFYVTIDPENDSYWTLEAFNSPGIKNRRAPYQLIMGTASSFKPALQDLITRVGNYPILAHNAAFERRFLAFFCRKYHIPFSPFYICSLEMAKRVLPGHKSYNLGNLSHDLGFRLKPEDKFHNALVDANMTANVWQHILDVMRNNRRLAEPFGVQLFENIQSSEAPEYQKLFNKSHKQEQALSHWELPLNHANLSVKKLVALRYAPHTELSRSLVTITGFTPSPDYGNLRAPKNITKYETSGTVIQWPTAQLKIIAPAETLLHAEYIEVSVNGKTSKFSARLVAHLEQFGLIVLEVDAPNFADLVKPISLASATIPLGKLVLPGKVVANGLTELSKQHLHGMPIWNQDTPAPRWLAHNGIVFKEFYHPDQKMKDPAATTLFARPPTKIMITEILPCPELAALPNVAHKKLISINGKRPTSIHDIPACFNPLTRGSNNNEIAVSGGVKISVPTMTKARQHAICEMFGYPKYEFELPKTPKLPRK